MKKLSRLPIRSTLKTTVYILLVMLVLFPSVVAAQQSEDDIDSIIGNTPFYDPDACTGPQATSTVSSTAVSGNASDNEKAIWNWLVGQGLSGAQAAGIMGNIQQESDFDPTIVQGGGDSNNPASAGSGGWGLVQWTPGAKVLQDQTGAKATGNIDSIQTQLQIMWWEAQGNGQWAGEGNTIQKVAAVTGSDNTAAEQVASIWVNDFEHAGIIGPRGAYADQILATAKAQNWTNANATSASGNLANQGTAGSTASATSNSTDSGVNCCPTTPSSTANTNATEASFSSLSGDQAISGTFILGFQASTPKATIESVFKQYKPAGMYILGTTDAAAAGFNSTFYQALAIDAGHPIIASSDEEGLFTRYKYNFNFPSAGEMSTMSTSQVQALGKQVGQAMAANGLNVDLAPVLDVGTGDSSDFHEQAGRTFGDSASTVISKAGAFAAGLNSAGIRPVYKHFPGLGSSTGDTDNGPVTSPSLSQLEQSDLLPYQSLDDQNNAAVMMDNAMIPGLTGNTPASQSAAAVSLLRNKYSFNGLIVTDDLYAKSVSPSDSTAQLGAALAKALEAGVDAPLETYTSNAALDAAIADAKAAHVNTSQALASLDNFVPKPAAQSTAPATSCCGSSSTTAATGAASGQVYIVGDSIMDLTYYGSFAAGVTNPTGPLASALKAGGLTAKVDSNGGRGMGYPGTAPNGGLPGSSLSGLGAISADASIIKNSSAVVVELGTNETDPPAGATSSATQFAQQVQQAVTAIKQANPTAKIYWVNIFSNPQHVHDGSAAGTYTPWSAQYNQVLSRAASSDGINIIDTTNAGITLQSDDIHPTENASGTGKLSSLIVQALQGNSGNAANGSAAACCPSSSTTSTASGPLVKFYDSTTPSALPDQTHGASYSTGGFASNADTPLKIAQSASLSTDEAAASSSNVLDIEPMAASPSFAAPWAQARAKLTNGIIILYEAKGDLSAVEASVASLPSSIQSRVKYWVASLGAAQINPSNAWGTQYAWGSTYDSDVTTQAGWQEVLESPPTGAGSSVAGTTGASCTAGTGNVVDPFPGGWIPNRLDMGYDGTFKGQIVAPFNGTIQYSGGTTGWEGSLMVVIKADSNEGLPNSQSVYFTEGVKPIVSNGAHVTAGTPIADAAISPYGDAYATTANGLGQIEWGVADGTAQQGVQPNTEAIVLGIKGTCSPTTQSKAMDLAFYAWAQKVVPGNATTQQCAGAP